MVGAGLGGGGATFNVGGSSESLTDGFFKFRMGAGLTESILIMGEVFTYVGEKNDITLKNYGMTVAGQFFLLEGLYARPSIGFSRAEAETSIFGVTLSSKSDVGLSAGTALGYEFRS